MSVLCSRCGYDAPEEKQVHHLRVAHERIHKLERAEARIGEFETHVAHVHGNVSMFKCGECGLQLFRVREGGGRDSGDETVKP